MLKRCFICKKEIDNEQFENGEAILLNGPKNALVGAHTRHKGIMTEYDEQLETKEMLA